VGSSTTSRPSRTRALIVMEGNVTLAQPPNKRLLAAGHAAGGFCWKHGLVAARPRLKRPAVC
jgi:hypothetical protein